MSEERSCRIRRRTSFYKGGDRVNNEKQIYKKPLCKKKLSFDRGIVPQNLKSIIRKKSSATSIYSTPSRCRMVRKKRRNKRKPLRFNEKCSIRFISPLPGWREDHVRMPTSDSSETEGENNDEHETTISNTTILQKVQITPESVKKLATFNLEDNDAIIKFNAIIAFEKPKLEEKPILINKKYKESRVISWLKEVTTEVTSSVEKDRRNISIIEGNALDFQLGDKQTAENEAEEIKRDCTDVLDDEVAQLFQHNLRLADADAKTDEKTLPSKADKQLPRRSLRFVRKP